jgi:hypothetical protein
MDYKKKLSKLHHNASVRRYRRRKEPSVKEANRLSHSKEELHHCCAQEPYSFISRGPSYGRGQTVSHIFSSFHITDLEILGAQTTKEEKSEQAEEAKTRWQEGAAMYSTLDSLQS